MLDDIPPAIFMIEGGHALQLVQAHIEARMLCEQEVRAICKELGVQHIRRDRRNGKVTSVQFPGAVPSGWCKPGRYDSSRPRRGSDWSKRFAAQVGFPDPAEVISQALQIPLSIGYTQQHGEGWMRIGSMLTECGFLYLSAEGPYAMWCPDVPAYVAALEAEGDKQIKEPAKSFRLQFDGCRRIHREEWDLLVLQQQLAAKPPLCAPAAGPNVPACGG